MTNSISFILFLSTFSVKFFPVESCCPYFQTETFKKTKLPLLNTSANCISPYNTLTTSGTFFSGDKWCMELYAGRVYCKYACLTYINIDATNIECQKIDCGADPNSASSIMVTCNCHGINSKTGQYGSGITPPHSWFEAESLFLSTLCPAGGVSNAVNVVNGRLSNTIQSDINYGGQKDLVNQSISSDYSYQTSDSNSRVINNSKNIRNKKVIFVFNDKPFDASSDNGFRKRVMDMINENLSANDTMDKRK